VTLPDALPDDLTRILRAVGMALNRSEGFRGGRMKTPLLNGIVLVGTAFLSHSSAAKSRALVSEIFRRRASRSSAFFSSVETRQLYTSVFMH
jgi:hypothetical protein